MKKLAVYLFAVMAVAVVAGCNSTGQNESKQDADSAKVSDVNDSVVDADSAENVIAVDSAAIVDEGQKQKEKEEQELCLKLLRSIHSQKGYSEIFEDRWVKKHCTARMRKMLIDAYDYDLAPGEVAYGSWIIGGWDAGEEEIEFYPPKFAALGNGLYSVTQRPIEGFIGERVLHYRMVVENGIAKIDDAMKVEDAHVVDVEY